MSHPSEASLHQATTPASVLRAPSAKINNLQAIRAFAAVMVVIFHTGFILPHLHAIGSFGVEVFFVLSGYIMARICEKNPRYFMRRRLIRIVPPYWFLTILLFVFALGFPALLNNTSASIPDLFKSLFFIPFFKMPEDIIRPVLFVGWSLNYEMFFYVLIWLSLIVLPRRPLLLASGVILAAHVTALFFTQPWAYLWFLRASYIVEFPLGVLVYHIAKRIPPDTARRWRWASALLLILSALALMYVQAVRPPVSPAALALLYNCLSSLLVLSASLLSQGGWDTRWAPLILVGDASYILYLVHPYCEYFLGRVIVPHLPLLRIDRPLGCLIAVAVSIAVGLLLHLYAERPVLQFLNERFGGHRRSAEFRVLAESKGQVNP